MIKSWNSYGFHDFFYELFKVITATINAINLKISGGTDMWKKVGTIALATVLLGGLVGTSQASAMATGEQQHALKKPYVVYGSAAQQKHQVGQTLGATSNYTKLTTTGADAAYLGLQGVSDSVMISSVSLAPGKEGAGTLVNIETFEGKNNISQVTAQQYAMAATMAGLKDVIITVTSNAPVSGEAALAGVYKAVEEDGIELNNDNTMAANSVLSATSSAIAENADDAKYAGKLTSAVTETTGEVAADKQAGKTININIIIDKLTINLDKQGIKDQTSADNVNAIATAIQTVNNAPISDSASFVKATNDLAGKLSDSAGDLMAKAKDFANSQDAKEVANWFTIHIWEPIKNFFSGLFGGNE